VTATVEDTGGPGPASGVSAVEVVLATPDGFRPQVRLRRDSADGAWHGTHVVAPGRAGSVRATFVDLEDRADNLRVIRLDAGAPSVSVRSAVDLRRPRLLSVDVAPTRVDTHRAPATVRIRAHLTDDVGVVSVVGGLVLGRRDEAETNTVLHLRSGTARDGFYTGRVTIAPGHPGTWFAGVHFADGAHQVFRDLPHPPTVVVVDRRDRTRPTTARPRVVPSDVDVRAGDRTVAVSVRARCRLGRGSRASAAASRARDAVGHAAASDLRHPARRRVEWACGVAPLRCCRG
jgi:hypothetical protein